MKRFRYRYATWHTVEFEAEDIEEAKVFIIGGKALDIGNDEEDGITECDEEVVEVEE